MASGSAENTSHVARLYRGEYTYAPGESKSVEAVVGHGSFASGMSFTDLVTVVVRDKGMPEDDSFEGSSFDVAVSVSDSFESKAE